MASRDSQIDKPQRGRPKRAELPGVNINTGAQSINTERASLNLQNKCGGLHQHSVCDLWSNEICKKHQDLDTTGLL